MKLLIVTQKVDRDDAILGFFHRWIEEFAKHCESVLVICLGEGKHDLPSNVKVYSLGKEQGTSKLKQLTTFYSLLFTLRKQYDSVFVHMNQIYVVLGGLLWRMWGKRVGLWYVHRAVSFSLRLATILAHTIFTSSQESFGIKSKKVRYVGHGVDTERFVYSEPNFDEPISILHVGRITKIKNIETILRAVKILKDKGIQVRDLVLVGAPKTKEDEEYKLELEMLIKDLGIQDLVVWKGEVANHDLPTYYRQSTFSINACPDGGMDKVVLESLASGRPAFFSNKAFASLYGEYTDRFQFKHTNADDLVGKVMDLNHDQEIVSMISKEVQGGYSVESLVHKIVDAIDS